MTPSSERAFFQGKFVGTVVCISLVTKALFWERFEVRYGCCVMPCPVVQSSQEKIMNKMVNLSANLVWLQNQVWCYSGSCQSAFSTVIQTTLLLGPKVVIFYMGRFGLAPLRFLFTWCVCALKVQPDRQDLCFYFKRLGRGQAPCTKPVRLEHGNVMHSNTIYYKCYIFSTRFVVLGLQNCVIAS